ncbi:MAG TPA: hypothetical protein DIW81_27570 [Planctomycetaceae bacterium]|nr:hypothetical protein [Rubinisphaera sp.]HCS55302.1 hypothetical protein [Planctomycetaceae bacterium]
MQSQKGRSILKFILGQIFAYPFTILVIWIPLYVIIGQTENEFHFIDGLILIAILPLSLVALVLNFSTLYYSSFGLFLLTVLIVFNWGISKFLNWVCNSLQDSLFEKLE